MSTMSVRKAVLAASVGLGILGLGSAAQASSFFTPGNLVISVYGGNGVTDNLATAVTLKQLSLSGITSGGVVTAGAKANVVSQLVVGGSNPFSGEYGSSSEGILQRTQNGKALVIAGYDVDAATYNANPASFGGGTKSCITPGMGSTAVNCNPLAQTATASAAATKKNPAVIGVQREIAVIGANGSMNDTTTLGNVAFSGNNPRSVASVDGKSFYVSGQGNGKTNGENDQGVFYTTLGSTTNAKAIDNTYDTRVAQIYNNKLYVSTDSTEGSGVRETIGSYGGLPTATVAGTGTPLLNPNTDPTKTNTGPYAPTSSSQLNGLPIDSKAEAKAGGIYLSPEQYFFANDTTLYIADSGNPKGDNNGAKDANGNKTPQGLSDGGLQKWSLVGGTWVLDYTITAGLLDFVADTTSCGPNQVNCGTTGLIGLTGMVVGGNVELFATNSTLGDEDQTYLYGITDGLSFTTQAQEQAANEGFVTLMTADAGTNIRGVAFAPVPEPSVWAMMLVGVASMGGVLRRSRKTTAAAV